MAELEPRIREITVGYLDELVGREGFDVIADFAGRLPMDVISEMLGVPAPDRAELRTWADLLVHRDEGVFDVPPKASRPSRSCGATSRCTWRSFGAVRATICSRR